MNTVKIIRDMPRDNPLPVEQLIKVFGFYCGVCPCCENVLGVFKSEGPLVYCKYCGQATLWPTGKS